MNRLFFYIKWIFIFEGLFILTVVANDEKETRHNKEIDLFLENENPFYSDQYIKDAFSEFKLKENDGKRTSSLMLSSNIVLKLKNRPLLKSWFYQRSANMYTANKQYSDAVSQLIAATNILDAIYANVVVDRQTVLNKLGNLYLLKGDKENADKVFLEAQSYPYATFTIRNSDALRRLETVYRRAVMGLIMTRAGNVKKLKEIVIIPAANDLRPTLEEAIKQAESKMDEE